MKANEGWREKPVMKGYCKRQGCWMTSHSFTVHKKHKKHLKLINWWGRRQTNGHQGPSLCPSCRLFRELVCRNCQIAGASLIGGQGCWAFSCLQPLHYTGWFTRRSSCLFWQRFRPHISSFKATLMDSKLEHDHSWATGTSDTKSTPQSVGQHQRHSETLLILITNYNNLINSMRRRCVALCEANGGHTRYWLFFGPRTPPIQ